MGSLNKTKQQKGNHLTQSFPFNLDPLRIKIIGSCYLILSMTRRDSVCKEERTQCNTWVLNHRQPRRALPQAHTHRLLSWLFPISSCFQVKVTQQVCYGISRLVQSLFARQLFLNLQCLTYATSDIHSRQLTRINYRKCN